MTAEALARHPPIADRYFRRAADHALRWPNQAGDVHRAGYGWGVDYGLQDVTNGAARAVATGSNEFQDKPGFRSPWHYHECHLQIALVLRGSVELAFAPDQVRCATAGDVFFIPGHVIHDVNNPSSDYQVLEVSFPGTFTTIEAPIPAPGASSRGAILSSNAAVRTAGEGGLLLYDHRLEGLTDGHYSLRRIVRDRVAPVSSAWRQPRGALRLTVITGGTADVETEDGARASLSAQDLALLPAGRGFRYLDASRDYTAIELTVAAP